MKIKLFLIIQVEESMVNYFKYLKSKVYQKLLVESGIKIILSSKQINHQNKNNKL